MSFIVVHNRVVHGGFLQGKMLRGDQILTVGRYTNPVSFASFKVFQGKVFLAKKWGLLANSCSWINEKIVLTWIYLSGETLKSGYQRSLTLLPHRWKLDCLHQTVYKKQLETAVVKIRRTSKCQHWFFWIFAIFISFVPIRNLRASGNMAKRVSEPKHSLKSGDVKETFKSGLLIVYLWWHIWRFEWLKTGRRKRMNVIGGFLTKLLACKAGKRIYAFWPPRWRHQIRWRLPNRRCMWNWKWTSEITARIAVPIQRYFVSAKISIRRIEKNGMVSLIRNPLLSDLGIMTCLLSSRKSLQNDSSKMMCTANFSAFSSSYLR